MKKISIIAISAAVLGVFASCQPKDVVVFNPESVKAPVLGEIEDVVLTPGSENITVAFEAADFGVAVPTGYDCIIEVKGAGSALLAADYDVAEGVMTITSKNLNTAILNAGGEAEKALAVLFTLNAYTKNDKGAKVGEYYPSNTVETKITAYPADLLDVDVYPHVWIIGAGESIGAWGFETIVQYLYDYEEKGVYTGVIDYQWDAAKGWKMTGTNAWDSSCNWGLDGAADAPDAEAPSLNIISDGGSSDIKVYSSRFYKWEFDKNALVLKKIYGFDNIGVVGSLNSWNAADPAMKMKFNATTHKFFLDVNIPDGTEMKFTCDDNWNLNFGVDCEQGGANIVPDVTGNVRIYLDLNKNEYEFNASKFGAKEDGKVYDPGDKQEYPSNMYMIGNFCGWSWDNAFEMAKINGSTAKFWTLAYLVAGEGFKFCDAKAWSGDFCTLDTNIGFDVDGGNCVVSTTGIYAVAVDCENKTVSVEPAQIKGIGDAFLGWSDPVIFTVNGSKAYALTADTANLRMYCDVTYYATDWWRMEFNLYDGKIVFRGDGGDQPAVPVEFGQKVTLDLSNQTGTIQ